MDPFGVVLTLGLGGGLAVWLGARDRPILLIGGLATVGGLVGGLIGWYLTTAVASVIVTVLTLLYFGLVRHEARHGNTGSLGAFILSLFIVVPFFASFGIALYLAPESVGKPTLAINWAPVLDFLKTWILR